MTLIACPFCGATPAVVVRDVEPQGDSWYGKTIARFVLCDCGASLFDGSFHEGFVDNDAAVAAWNRRIAAHASLGSGSRNEP